MNIETLRRYCLSKAGVTEGMPFGDGILVFKAGNKMFALFALDDVPLRINLKCDPELALQLREKYDAVLPGYHMNKQHWNTVVLDGTIPSNEVLLWIDNSYTLIIESLPAKVRDTLNDPATQPTNQPTKGKTGKS